MGYFCWMDVKEYNRVRIAVLNLYEGQANEGMRCIRELINQFGEMYHLDLQWDEFEVRVEQEVPDLTYDIYISSGGPGSPLESENSEWENRYFQWITAVEQYNANPLHVNKKHVLFICHSYQLACRYFRIARVTRRKSTAFGVFPIHLMEEASSEHVFNGLEDPFYAVDSRDYQVIEADESMLQKTGAKILAIEKERPHIPLERAIMAIRFNDYMIGTQFHPEADAVGMTMYLQRDDKKQGVIENHGYDKWKSMIDQLNDPDKILWTYSHVIPNFLFNAVKKLQTAEVE